MMATCDMLYKNVNFDGHHQTLSLVKICVLFGLKCELCRSEFQCKAQGVSSVTED